MYVSRLLTNPVTRTAAAARRLFTEDERDYLQSVKQANVVRVRPIDLPDRNKDFSSWPLGKLY